MDENLFRNNIKTFLNSAEFVYNNQDFTSATILCDKIKENVKRIIKEQKILEDN